MLECQSKNDIVDYDYLLPLLETYAGYKNDYLQNSEDSWLGNAIDMLVIIYGKDADQVCMDSNSTSWEGIGKSLDFNGDNIVTIKEYAFNFLKSIKENYEYKKYNN